MDSKRIYAEAMRFLGTEEVPGEASNPLISHWIKSAARWLDRDDSKTAWCGCFRGAVGVNSGTGVPKDHFRAASWKSWGEAVPTADAAVGDTVVLSRKGGKHVALFHKWSADRKRVFLLGGNQSNKVSIASFDASLIEAVRR